VSTLTLQVSGSPTAEELAAVVAVLSAASSTAPAAQEQPVPSRWNDRAALLRRPLFPGPGAWNSLRSW
jgi:hypothetical protein